MHRHWSRPSPALRCVLAGWVYCRDQSKTYNCTPVYLICSTFVIFYVIFIILSNLISYHPTFFSSLLSYTILSCQYIISNVFTECNFSCFFCRLMSLESWCCLLTGDFYSEICRAVGCSVETEEEQVSIALNQSIIFDSTGTVQSVMSRDRENKEVREKEREKCILQSCTSPNRYVSTSTSNFISTSTSTSTSRSSFASFSNLTC